MRRMKDSGIAWIGEIPESWAIKRLKFICTINPRVNIDDINPETEVSFLPMDNIKYGYFVNTIIKKISEYCLSYNIFNNGDILLAKVTPCFENGNIAIANNLKNCIGFGTSEIFVVRVNNSDNKFLFYYFRNELFRQRAIATMSGTGGLKRISPQFMRDEKILFPPFSEQHRITAYLDAKCAEIDRSMELVRQSMDTLKAYKMSVITEAVTKGLDSDVPMKDSGVPWIGEMPIKWRIVPLKKQLINIVDYRGKTPEKVSSGVFLVTAKNIKNGKIDYSLSQEYVDENEYYSIMSRGLPKNGDLLFTTEAPLGEVAIVDREDIALAQRIIKFTVNTFILNNLFLKYWITSSGFQFFLHTLSTGSTAEGIKSSKISMLPLVLPSLPEQHRIAAYLDAKCAEIDAIITQKQALLDKLTAYRKSLIYECVTGKREVAA